jgi:hypothetical protein
MQGDPAIFVPMVLPPAYVNMPRFGLGKAVEPVPATGHMQQARGRLKGAV